MTRLRIGFTYSELQDFVAPGEFAKRAEGWGYDTFWVTDHALKQRMDPLTILAAVSQTTSTIRLGTAVLAVPYRNPYLTAKTAASVDRLSNGRLMLGLGVGDLFQEFAALEVDRRVRGRMSDERLEIIRRFLSEENVSFSGEFHNYSNITLLPRPVQEPRIPIWIGAHWDGHFVDAALKRTARFGDGFIPTYTPVDAYQQVQERIIGYAEEQGRHSTDIEWGVQIWVYVGDNTEQGRRIGTAAMKQRFGVDDVDYTQATSLGSANDCTEVIEAYREKGVTEFNLSVVCPPAEMAEQYERIAMEVLPRVAPK